MDHILEQAANVGLADLANNGGGTYERGTLFPFRPDHGFAVGIGGVTLPAESVNAESFAWACRMAASEYEAAFVGTWLDEATVCFDAVAYFGDRDEAIVSGRAHGQKAIFDFATKSSIIL